MDVKSSIKSFFSSTANVITFIIALLVAVILLLIGKTENLKALLRLGETMAKDNILTDQLKDKQRESKAEADKAARLKKDLKDNLDAADKSNPEDFWKKH